MSLRNEILKNHSEEEISLLIYILEGGYFDFCIKQRYADITIRYLRGQSLASIAAEYRISVTTANHAFRTIYYKIMHCFFPFYLDFLTASNLDWPPELKQKKLEKIAREAYDYPAALLKYKERAKDSPYSNFKAQFPQDCTRIMNSLYGSGIRNLHEMQNYSRNDLSARFGFGPASYQQLKKVLENRGMNLKDDDAPKKD